jgi:Co/Zn/Cd efflux system component
MPDFKTMIVVSVLALIANVLCLYLLQKNKSKEAHMQASMIFTSNDVIINSGVIIAGFWSIGSIRVIGFDYWSNCIRDCGKRCI